MRAFFVGPGKCGTSWLYAFASAHPDLNVGAGKDPGTLLSDRPDLARYEHLWGAGGIVRCDFSNTYVFSGQAMKNISESYPDAKVLLTLRDPVERLISQFSFMRRNGRFKGTLATGIRERADIVDRCRYLSYGSPWLDAIPESNLAVLRLETLRRDEKSYQQRLCRFLEIDASKKIELDRGARLPAAEPRSRLLSRATKRSAEIVRNAGGLRVVDSVKRSRVTKILYKELPVDYQSQLKDQVPMSLADELREGYDNFVARAHAVGATVI